MHVRTAIRNAASDAIEAALPAHHVFNGRWAPVSADELPCAIIVIPSEEAEPSSATRIGTVARAMSLRVILVRSDDGSDELDASLDEDAAAVEAALTSARLGGFDIHYRGSELDHSTSGDQPIGRLALTFQAVAHTKRGNPNAAL